jgi:hypothetical protein
LRNSSPPFLLHVLYSSLPDTGLENAVGLLFCKRLPNLKLLSYKGEISSQQSIYNPFSAKLNYWGAYIIGRQIYNFLDWPKL